MKHWISKLPKPQLTINGHEPFKRHQLFYHRKTNRKYGAILGFVRLALKTGRKVQPGDFYPVLGIEQASNALQRLSKQKEAVVVKPASFIGGKRQAIYELGEVLEHLRTERTIYDHA